MLLVLYRGRRRLAGLTADLSADPQLRVMLAMFSWLHDGEPLPALEQVSPAGLAGAWARRRAGRVTAVMIAGAAAAAIAAGAAAPPLCARPGPGRFARYAACPAAAQAHRSPPARASLVTGAEAGLRFGARLPALAGPARYPRVTAAMSANPAADYETDFSTGEFNLG